MMMMVMVMIMMMMLIEEKKGAMVDLTHKEEENLDSISMMVACGRSVAVMSSSLS